MTDHYVDINKMVDPDTLARLAAALRALAAEIMGRSNG
jgi:hypothetical protein